MPRLITLLTDFGFRDPFVGVMKGVIAGISPGARVVDLTHGVDAQDVEQGGFLWAQAVPYFPRHTIHVAVVDPGVGSDRRVVAVKTAAAVFLAPDNGIIAHVVEPSEIRKAVEVQNRRYFLDQVSNTFHGRDVFAPVAARLANGLALGRLGPEIDDLRIPERRSSRVEAVPGHPNRLRMVGKIQDVDRFGNCVTDIAVDNPDDVLSVQIGRRRLSGLVRSYSAVPVGKPLAVVGSAGWIEIAVRDGRADATLGIGRSDTIKVVMRQPGRRERSPRKRR